MLTRRSHLSEDNTARDVWRICEVESGKNLTIVQSGMRERVIYAYGERVPDTPLRCKFDSGEIISDFLCDIQGLAIVSDRLRSIVEEVAPSQAQFVPMSIDNVPFGTPSFPPYWFLNPLRVVDCIDRTKGTWHMDKVTGKMTPGLIVIDRGSIPADAHIFVVEMLRPLTLVSDRLRKAIKRAKLLGVSFMNPDSPDPFW